jgi:hypothetical protein
MNDTEKISQASYRLRDEALLRHLANYGVLLNAVASELFFSGKPCNHIVRKLTESQAIVSYLRTIPGGISYARLSAASCRRLGLPESHAMEIRGTVLDSSIALVCYCCLATHRRYRLQRDDLISLCGKKDAPLQNTFHILTSPEELGRVCLMRVLVTTGSQGQTLKQLKKYAAAAYAHPALAAWLGPAGDYGFCVLAPTPQAKVALDAAIKRSGLRESLLIEVGWGPNAASLASYLRQRTEQA